MNTQSEFSIPYVGLKVGQHDFVFKVNQSFFSHFANSFISDGKIDVRMNLDKRENFIILNFKIDGFVNTICDRCSENFDLELIDDQKIIVKFKQPDQKIVDEDDVIFINANETHLNVKQLVYEFILLSMPMKKACELKDDGKPSCNKKVYEFFSTEEKQIEIENKKIDPRWGALEKLKKNIK